MEGFALIQTQFRWADEVARHIAALEGIVRVEGVSGPYDIVARVRRSCEHELVQCLEEEIRSVPGVTRVVVCPLAHHARMWEGPYLPKQPTILVSTGFMIAKTSDGFLSLHLPHAPYLPPKPRNGFPGGSSRRLELVHLGRRFKSPRPSVSRGH